VIGVLVFFGAGVLLAVSLRSLARRDRPGGGAVYRRTPPRRSTGPGRAVLRTMRAVNDVRAVSRGPGAIGRHVATRRALRSISRW